MLFHLSHIKAICPQGRGQTGVEPTGGSGDWQFCALSQGQLASSWRLMGPYHNSWRSLKEHPGLVGSVVLAQEEYFFSLWGLDSTIPKGCYPVFWSCLALFLSTELYLICLCWSYFMVAKLCVACHWFGGLELEQECRGLKWKGILVSSHLGQLMARSSWTFALGFLKSTVWN